MFKNSQEKRMKMGDMICICGQKFKKYLDFYFHIYRCNKIVEEIIKKDKG